MATPDTALVPAPHQGRPSKLTAKTKKKLFEAIELGATYIDACGYAGVNARTVRRWVEQGEQDLEADPPTLSEFALFVDGLREAEGKAVVKWMAKIEKAASEGNWQAAAWKLERRYPERYGRRIFEATTTTRLEVFHDPLTHAILADPTAIDAANELIFRLASGESDSPDESGGVCVVREQEAVEVRPAPQAD